jgi:endonuclease/exonuclease/phosphatase family metal-dependent hydrolase
MRAYSKPLLLGILFLFLLQLISDFIESIYAFGLLVTSFTIEVASIFLFFSPLILVFFRRGVRRPALLGLAILGSACRVAEPLLAPSGKMLVSGLGMAVLLVFFLAWLAGRASLDGRSVSLGLSMVILLSVFFRSLGSGSDWSLSNPLGSIALAFIAIVLLFQVDLDQEAYTQPTSRTSMRRLTGLGLGVSSVFVLIYFAFASPTVMARWTGFSYPFIVGALVIAMALCSALLGSARIMRLLTRPFVLTWNAVFVLALVFTILPHQISFPLDPAVYPIDAPTTTPLAALPLFIMLALSPVILVDFMLYTRAIVEQRPSTPQVGVAFGLAGLYFLLMVFFQVFTTIYDYVPILGPFFRDRFWFVFLLAGLGLSIPVLLLPRKEYDFKTEVDIRPMVGLNACLALATLFTLALTGPRPESPPSKTELKIMTYNIQQGYNAFGVKNLAGQLEVIRSIDPDVLGLQETDTARVANGNVDAVRYFADSLRMHSYYGPTTTTGTFGIALLSRYPLENPQTFFMFSEGEQTATIQARVTIGEVTYNVFVTHLGNGGPIIQLEEMLKRIQGVDRVIAMGDFNFRPATDQYALMTKTLSDAWLVMWPGGIDIPGYGPEKRIDYIFVSPGMHVLESEYAVNPASDHPLLFTIIGP